jgi:hypothetical protein
MNVQSASQNQTTNRTVPVDSKYERLLRRAMQANGGFSGISGLVSLLAANGLAAFTGIPEATVFRVLGVLLLLYAVDLFWITSREKIHPGFGITAVILDIAWVISSAILLTSNLVPLTTAGKWTILLLAEVVSIFALVQGYAIWKIRKNP